MPKTNNPTSYDRTVDIVRSAIPRMSELKIPITPSNYAVWYEYLSDSNEALRLEMDALLSRDAPITETEMRALYDRFLEERNEKVQFAKSALSKVVSALMSHISQADGHYSSFSSELTEVAESLSNDVTAENLNSLIDRAMRATNTALERGAELKQQFSSLAVEMQQVRGELARSQEEARSDALTGLHNRLAFQEELDNLAQAAREDSHAPVCCWSISISSNASTTLTATSRAITCCTRWRARSSRRYAGVTWWRGTAARNSRCCCVTRRAPAARRSQKMSASRSATARSSCPRSWDSNRSWRSRCQSVVAGTVIRSRPRPWSTAPTARCTSRKRTVATR